MSLEDHAEELASDLGVDKEEVTRDLENLVNYSVPMDEAKQSLRRKYGDGSSGGDNTPSSKAISEVTTDDSNVTVTAVVLTSGRRSIQYNGEQHVIREGELADETGKISYTAWDGFSGDLQPGQTVRLGNAGVREWDGQPELNLGDSTDPEVVDETLDIDYEVGGRAALQDLAPGDRGITVEVQVLECEQKVIDGRDGETTILSGVLGDESGRLPFTDWEPHAEIEEGASVRLEETFVREFRGAPSVNVSEFSTVTALDRTVEVAEDAPRLSIREAVESGGLFDVELAGNVIEVRDGSGLIERCPECGRVIQNGQCRSHGAVEGEDDLRTKAILDDGTATVTAVLDDELTARVYGGDLDDAREHARDAMNKEVVADRIADRIVGHEFVVRGSLSVDEYGANLTASTFAEADDDPATRARTLLQEAES
ncbi:Single-stranded DNA binding protein [Haloarcula sp. Atlit-120R]|uniref:Single-stranded DNA binding protein n=1 Tax=Haloarcula sp. Atlit-120R TaxID=2282135 RepID=UPI000EF1FAB1|nr:Single-stranded DNA binding protein [Haloarcula sp. Atlit-120R]RLM33796.1 Single-stranded DNA binding protein [Haloarcula sp. Atlit-120R]